jgi:parvulin-like peptidyl-prolyl isomerase
MPVKVNGAPLDDALIREEANLMRPHLFRSMPGADPRQVETRLREWAVENAIEKALLRQAALADPDPVPPEQIEEALRRIADSAAAPSEGQRAEIELRIRIDRLVTRHAGRIGAPKLKEVSEYYRKHREKFGVPERAHIGHIVKNFKNSGEGTEEAAALEAIQSIDAELRGGADFAAVAARSSDQPENGGDLGWISRGRSAPELDRVIFGLQPGHTSGIFRSSDAFHIVAMFAREPERTATFDEVRESIERAIMAEKRQRALERLVDRLRARAIIER